MKVLIFLIFFPMLGKCAALPLDALPAFRHPGVPGALYAKVEHGVPLTLRDVAILSRADVSKGAIIDYLYSYGKHFRLTAADVRELQREGVGSDLIDYMTSPSSHPHWFTF